MESDVIQKTWVRSECDNMDVVKRNKDYPETISAVELGGGGSLFGLLHMGARDSEGALT